MARVLLFKIAITTFALNDLFPWDSSGFPVRPLCPFLPCPLKTIDAAIFLMGFGLRKLIPTTQTLNNLSRFSGIRCPALTTTELMA